MEGATPLGVHREAFPRKENTQLPRVSLVKPGYSSTGSSDKGRQTQDGGRIPSCPGPPCQDGNNSTGRCWPLLNLQPTSSAPAHTSTHTAHTSTHTTHQV